MDAFTMMALAVLEEQEYEQVITFIGGWSRETGGRNILFR